jgi:ATP-binding cassette subfamily C (CFTR/MRP) protein 1
MLYLSYLEHHRCFRPSTLIVLYLSLLSVSDLTRTCALWVLYGVTRPSILMTISTVLGFALVGLESWGKSRHIPDKHEGKDRPEMFSGIVNRAVYFWLRGLLHIGARGRLELDQLFALDEEMASAGLHKAFEKEYLKRKRDCRFPSIWTLAIVLRRPILATALPRLVMLGLSVSQPILTERLLRYLDPTVHTSQVSIGSGLIGAYALQYLGLAISTSLFYQLHFRVISMVRGCLVSALNAKMGHLDMTLMENANASVTLMSTDMQQINIGLQRFHDLWANILQVAIASYLLEKQVGIACVFPIVIVACCAVASICTSSWSKTRQDQWMKKVETRISATSSLLSAVKEIKMKGLLPGGTSRIQDLRTAELRSANRFRLTIVWSLILAYIPNFLSPVMTFLVFILQAQAKDTRFDATRAFTSLSILIILTQPLAATLQGVPLLAAAVGSLGRVDAFLRAQCPVDIRSFPLQGPQTMTAASKPAMAVDVQGSGIELQETIKKDERVVNFHNVVFQTFNANLSWDDKHDVLCNVSISIPRGHLTCIVGPVASGKTSLCRALLGEGQCRQGTVCMYSDSTDVAFCSQTPWLTNSSIRQNIIGFSDGFDADWYSAVLKACGLYADLKTMVASDQTIVGNDGTAISGGQRQRVCLARAIYSRRSVLILDDILSGLDKHTARHVFHHAIGPVGLARKMGATVVYASHPGSYLTYADHVIMLGTDDKIPKEGNLKELDLDIEDSTDEERTTVTQGDLSHIELSTETTTSGQAVTLEDSEPPPADGSVHAFYFRSAGFWILFVLLVATGVQTASTVFATYWIRLWTANADGNDMFYWGIYCSIQCIGLIFLAGAAYQAVVVLITKSGSVLHQVLLTTVSHAQLAVLGATDSGKILNHFSQDIELIDRDLPFSLINTLLNVLTASGQSILIITIFPWSGIAIAGCLILLYALQKFYIRTSRQLRLLDLEAKSPLYSNYTDTLKGMSTLRAYGWLDKNFEVAQQLLDRSQRPAYLLLMVQQWLNFVLNMIVACVAVIIASIAVLQKSQQGTTGVALTLIMSIATMLQQALRAWTLFEISLGAISRIKMFQEHTPKERQTHSVNPPPDWPLHGQIELDNVVAAYRYLMIFEMRVILN